MSEAEDWLVGACIAQAMRGDERRWKVYRNTRGGIVLCVESSRSMHGVTLLLSGIAQRGADAVVDSVRAALTRPFHPEWAARSPHPEWVQFS